MRKKWQLWVAIILLVAGLALLSIEPVKTALVAGYRPTVTHEQAAKNQRQTKQANYNMNQVKAVTMNQVINARLHAKDVKPVGQILVPTADVHLPIALGVANNTLMLAAGTMRADQQMGKGNYALAGHHMLNKQALFSPLYYKARVGTKVYLTDMNKVYQYQITTRKIISPYDVQVIDNTKQPLITLITCNDSGSKRLLLRGKLIATMALKQAPAAVVKLLHQKTNNYNVLAGY
ncbi:class A sortase [Nicoliella spurrieriana]|uniref:Class A sortase n=1 Tax=Nicoliella spurrieriana TaxID=2925830 RepID=A0A976RT45_9LACO|nr:class A sortase [Nicoliella spurrieriana]UQS87410.1 class A sortase [Nicoliella spurrieriana]